MFNIHVQTVMVPKHPATFFVSKMLRHLITNYYSTGLPYFNVSYRFIMSYGIQSFQNQH